MTASHWSDLTQYSKIYSHKYWGNFPTHSFITGGLNLPDDEVVHNRIHSRLQVDSIQRVPEETRGVGRSHRILYHCIR